MNFKITSSRFECQKKKQFQVMTKSDCISNYLRERQPALRRRKTLQTRDFVLNTWSLFGCISSFFCRDPLLAILTLNSGLHQCQILFSLALSLSLSRRFFSSSFFKVGSLKLHLFNFVRNKRRSRVFNFFFFLFSCVTLLEIREQAILTFYSCAFPHVKCSDSALKLISCRWSK